MASNFRENSKPFPTTAERQGFWSQFLGTRVKRGEHGYEYKMPAASDIGSQPFLWLVRMNIRCQWHQILVASH